jgi:hypothetical protein
MTLGNMYEQGVHHLIAFCHNDACRHHATRILSAPLQRAGLRWIGVLGVTSERAAASVHELFKRISAWGDHRSVLPFGCPAASNRLKALGVGVQNPFAVRARPRSAAAGGDRVLMLCMGDSD